jgi:2-polyprenyl-3-methyl-5-hydroxy-6-metoxy-1,4-benzoquinol methylase
MNNKLRGTTSAQAKQQLVNNFYRKNPYPWGKEPSLCAVWLLDRLSPSSLVLDYGGGGGRCSYAFARAGHNVVCVDVSHTGLKAAQTLLFDGRNRGIVTANVDFVCGDFDALREDGKKFDAINVHRVLQALKPNPRKEFIRTAANLLKPGGYLSLSITSTYEFDPEIMILIDKKGKPLEFADSASLKAYLINGNEKFARFKDAPRNGLIMMQTKASIRSLLKEHFDIIDMYHTEDFPTNDPETKMNVYVVHAFRKQDSSLRPGF